MLELRLSKKELENMRHIKTMASEADFYKMPYTDKYILKIYIYNDCLEDKNNKIDALNLFNKEEKIKELVIPGAKVYVDNEFKGELLRKINGSNAYNYLDRKDISLKEKINVLKKIGRILEKIGNSNPEYNACFSDVHAGNFMVDNNNNVHAIDTTGMKILDIPGSPNFYIYYLINKNLKKYDIEFERLTNTSQETDIYCYVMMIMELLLNTKRVISFNMSQYKKCLNLIDKLGFDSRLVNSFSSVVDDYAKNINPASYLDTIDEEKVNILRKEIYKQFTN